ncbi:MAG: hypothetical protein GEU90_15480, partial [Gemmatimonas sp.]|nr:hypothetical protein [Gemmatimonas sp.]
MDFLTRLFRPPLAARSQTYVSSSTLVGPKNEHVMTLRPLRLTQICVALLLAVASACSDTPSTQPASRTASLALVPTFPANDLISLEDLEGVRVTIQRQDSSLVVERTVAIEDHTVDLSLRVEFIPPCEDLLVQIQILNSNGDTVFEAGPTDVTVCDDGEVPVVETQLTYVGVGADAESVSIVPETLTVIVGESFTLEGQALGADGEPIPGTPIRWTSLDSELASITDESDGSGQALSTGTAQIEASLLTGPSSVATLNLVSPPSLVRSPETLTFAVEEGGSNPADQTL